MSKPNLTEKLNYIQQNGGSIMYTFADGTKQSQNINKEVFFNERDRKRTSAEILEIFKEVGHDLGAISFEF